MSQIYYGDWTSRSDVEKDFEVELGGDIDILVASYEIDGYEGHAFVLFRQDGKLFEVNGSHCSCYGLEDQWAPEETSLAAILTRKQHTYGALKVSGVQEALEAIQEAECS